MYKKYLPLLLFFTLQPVCAASDQASYLTPTKVALGAATMVGVAVIAYKLMHVESRVVRP